MRRQSAILWLAVAVVAVLVIYLLYLHSTATVGSKHQVQANKKNVSAPVGAGETRNQTPAKNSSKVYLVRPSEVLAMVNGTPITLWDLMPLQVTNNAEQQIDPTAYHYFLQRAINRELIMEAAKAHGITLSDSQQQQLDKFKAQREQPSPGLVSKLNVNSAEIEFELRDDQAFMLQTSIMAAAGYSPNVTEDQVKQYYQQHSSEYSGLPWQQIDIQIRNQLAETVRRKYQEQLDAYMNGLRSKANITETPLTETMANSYFKE